jgi:hypothetical protein
MNKKIVQTNEGSGYDLLPLVEKEHLLNAVQKRLGPRVDVLLSHSSLRSANSNVQWACNMYLRSLLKHSTPEQALILIRNLFRIDMPTTAATPTITSATATTVTEVHRSCTKNTLKFSSLPEALIHHIALSLDLCSIFALGNVSHDTNKTFSHLHSDSFWKFYGRIIYPLKRLDTNDSNSTTTNSTASSASSTNSTETKEATETTETELKYSHPTDPPSKLSDWYQVVLRSKLCEHYGSCPRCSVDALRMKTFKECRTELLRHQSKHCLLPCIFGFPSNQLIKLSKHKVLILGEDHILEQSPIWVCNQCGGGYGSWPFAYALSCDEKGKEKSNPTV